MKSVCIVAGRNVVFDGDVIFLDQDKSDCDVAVYINHPNSAIYTKAGLQIYSYGKMPKKGVKLKLLWFWHMIILRKSHVYLTGVLRKCESA